MPDWTQEGFGGRNEEGGAAAADSGGTSVTSDGAAADTKGSYAEIIASTLFDSLLSVFTFKSSQANSRDFLVDIAVGAAASEQDVISNILVSGRANSEVFMAPLLIAAGSRISARCQIDSGTGLVIDVTARLFGKTFLNSAPLGRSISYGPNTSDSGAVSIDPGGVANTEGSYSQIVASTDNPIRAAIIAIGGQANNSRTTASWLVDLSTGAAASEQNVVEDMLVSTDASGDDMRPQYFGPIPLNVPAGTRLAARAQCSITDATDRLFDIAVYGFD